MRGFIFAAFDADTFDRQISFVAKIASDYV